MFIKAMLTIAILSSFLAGVGILVGLLADWITEKCLEVDDD